MKMRTINLHGLLFYISVCYFGVTVLDVFEMRPAFVLSEVSLLPSVKLIFKFIGASLEN